MSDGQWLSDAKQGDPIAFQQLLIPHMSFLSRIVAEQLPRYARSVLDPEDVLQEVFLTAFREVKNFEPRTTGSLRGWLQAIAHHCMLDKLRFLNRAKRGRNFRQVETIVTRSGISEDVLHQLPTERRSPSSSAANHEAALAIRTVIQELPDDYRQAVELRLFEGKNLQEVSEIMDRTPRAIQGLIDRSKIKMRLALDGAFE